MEELRKEIAREIEKGGGRPLRQKARRSTLLLVGANGQVRKIGRFAGLAAFAAGVLACAALVAVVFFAVFHRPMAENRDLKAALAQSRKEARRLKDEKELLLAKLVVAQEKTRTQIRETTLEPVSETAGNETAEVDFETASAGVGAPAPVAEEPAAGKPDGVQPPSSAQESPAMATGRAVEPMVAVENLVFSRDAEAKELAVQFKILNEGPESEPISGRTFVVLESENPTDTSLLTIPRVPLENGRPAKVTSGRYFSIARFNTVTFKAKDPGPSYRFRGATVFVFALSGDLLLQRHFSIQKKAS